MSREPGRATWLPDTHSRPPHFATAQRRFAGGPTHWCPPPGTHPIADARSRGSPFAKFLNFRNQQREERSRTLRRTSSRRWRNISEPKWPSNLDHSQASQSRRLRIWGSGVRISSGAPISQINHGVGLDARYMLQPLRLVSVQCPLHDVSRLRRTPRIFASAEFPRRARVPTLVDAPGFCHFRDRDRRVWRLCPG